QLSDGRLLMPVALHTSTSKKDATIEELEKSFNSYGMIYCYYSDDEGKNWKRSPKLNMPENVISQEPGVVELKSGKVRMFIRTNSGYQYYAISNDRGETWGEPEKSGIISPLSPASIVRLPGSNKLLLIWNNNDQKE